MTKRLLPYGDVRNSGIVAKSGAHAGGAGKRARNRVLGGKIVATVRRTPA